jgi:subtilase family serine protease
MNRALTLGAALAALGSIALPVAALATPRHVDLPRNGNAPIVTGEANRQYFPFVPAAMERLGMRYIGPASVRKPITFHVETAMLNAAGLKAYATAANTPGSIYYRHWIGPKQIADSFGTPLNQYNASAAFFRSQGMIVGTWPMRTSLTVTGTQKQIETALHTKIGVFSLRGNTFFAASQALSVPLNVSITSIGGLTNAHLYHTDFVPGGPAVPVSGGFSNSRVDGMSPVQLADAYDLNTAYAKGYTGAGINLGIVGTGPISAADVPNFKKLYNVQGSSTVVPVYSTIDGDTTPPAVTGPCTSASSTAPSATCNPEDEEAQLDTEQAATLAPDATVQFYLGYNATNDTQGIGSPDDEVDQAIANNTADVLSLSYGACETLEGTPEVGTITASLTGGDATGHEPTEFSELAAEGVAVFVSSGDSGSAGCQRSTGNLDVPTLGYPSSDPNVVSVGGTTTPIGADGRLTGPIINWGSSTKSGGAAGGGISQLFNPPSFEKAQASSAAICVKSATSTNPLGGGGRCNPDVALDADPYTGASIEYDSGAGIGPAEIVPIGGTSQAAPDMAAMWADVLSACKQVASCQGPQPPPVTDPTSGFTSPSTIPRYRLGNPNFLLYPLVSTAAYHNVFYDITFGNDAVPPYAVQLAASETGETGLDYTVTDPGSVSAGPGFDNASGLGFPFGYALIKQLIPGAN